MWRTSAAEFASLAKMNDLRFLAYLLGMVVEEAKNQSRIASECRHVAASLGRHCRDLTKIIGATLTLTLRYAAAGGPNQVVSASASPGWVGSPTQPHIRRAESTRRWEQVTAPITGSSHVPTYLASTS